MAGIGLDSRIGAKFLNPGVGWGGSCFGKDIQSLLHTAREYGYSSKLLQASLDVNAAQRQMVIQKLQEKLYILKGRTIGLLGLAFKPDTDDLARRARSAHRRAPHADGRARQSLRSRSRMPPAASSVPISRCATAIAPGNWQPIPMPSSWSRSGASFTISTSPNSRGLMANPILMDGRNFFVPDTAIAAGFDYSGIGRCVRGRASQRADSAPAAS